jgi:hypothetical protein
MKQLIAAACLYIFVYASCNDKATYAASTITGKMLTSAPWKRVASTGQRQGMEAEDTWLNQLPCVRDNLYIFKPDQKFATDEGSSKCFAEDEQYESKTTWDISADGKMLMIMEPEELGGAQFPYEIEVLNGNTLKLKRVLDKLTVTETYVH